MTTLTRNNQLRLPLADQRDWRRLSPNAPLLIPPQTMRVWVAPWPDEGGTLHDETYLYLRLDNGHWVMEQP